MHAENRHTQQRKRTRYREKQRHRDTEEMVSCVQHCFYELLFLLVCTAAVMFEGICCGSVAVFTSQNLADVQALLDFRNALVDPSNALSSWKAENATSFCTWTGVECDIDGRVQTLKLSNIGLQGSISPSVAQLARLEVCNEHAFVVRRLFSFPPSMFKYSEQPAGILFLLHSVSKEET